MAKVNKKPNEELVAFGLEASEAGLTYGQLQMQETLRRMQEEKQAREKQAKKKRAKKKKA